MGEPVEDNAVDALKGVFWQDMPVLKLFYGPQGSIIRRVHVPEWVADQGGQTSEKQSGRVTLDLLTRFIQNRLFPSGSDSPSSSSHGSATAFLPTGREWKIRLRVGRPCEPGSQANSQTALETHLPDLILDSDDMLTAVVDSISQQVLDLDLGSIQRDLVADMQNGKGSQVDVDVACEAISSALNSTTSVLHLTVESTQCAVK